MTRMWSLRRGVLLALLYSSITLCSRSHSPLPRFVSSSAAPKKGNNKVFVGSNDYELLAAETTIHQFLNEKWQPSQHFRVQGWRWHTMSVIRDARRLSSLAYTFVNDNPRNHNVHKDKDEIPRLAKAAHHVIDFNLKALYRIENKLFYPWLKKKLSTVEDPNLGKAFSSVLNMVISEQKATEKLGMQVVRLFIVFYHTMPHFLRQFLIHFAFQFCRKRMPKLPAIPTRRNPNDERPFNKRHSYRRICRCASRPFWKWKIPFWFPRWPF